MDGWIKLFRSIQTHWIWQNPEYLKAWITILLTVNHDDKKVLVHGELVVCNRGQSLLSLNNWAKLFGKNWSIQRVRTFFDLLSEDQMLVIQGMRKTTRITVCNYDTYQDQQQTNNRQITFEQQTDNKQITTNKNDKNEKECKEQLIYKYQAEFFDSLIPFVSEFGKEMCREFYDYWSEPNKSKTKIRWQLEKTWDLKKRLTRWANNNFKKSNGQTFKTPSGGTKTDVAGLSRKAAIRAGIIPEFSTG